MRIVSKLLMTLGLAASCMFPVMAQSPVAQVDPRPPAFAASIDDMTVYWACTKRSDVVIHLKIDIDGVARHIRLKCSPSTVEADGSSLEPSTRDSDKGWVVHPPLGTRGR